jgi:hypothetical protein
MRSKKGLKTIDTDRRKIFTTRVENRWQRVEKQVIVFLNDHAGT